jgi:NAD(P)-dependent dehydrogenase (short-subunit alcohol dehydrogenase family)
MSEQTATFPDLLDKAVLITGGGTGIGAALTEGFVRQGAKVAFIDIAEAPSRELALRLAGIGRMRHCSSMPTSQDIDAIKTGGTHRPKRPMARRAFWSTMQRF